MTTRSEYWILCNELGPSEGLLLAAWRLEDTFNEDGGRWKCIFFPPLKCLEPANIILYFPSFSDCFSGD